MMLLWLKVTAATCLSVSLAKITEKIHVPTPAEGLGNSKMAITCVANPEGIKKSENLPISVTIQFTGLNSAMFA